MPEMETQPVEIKEKPKYSLTEEEMAMAVDVLQRDGDFQLFMKMQRGAVIAEFISKAQKTKEDMARKKEETKKKEEVKETKQYPGKDPGDAMREDGGLYP